MVSLTGRPDMTSDVYRGRKTTIQQYNNRTFSNNVVLSRLCCLVDMNHIVHLLLEAVVVGLLSVN